VSTATNIEWTDATWNPTRGCSRISTGCERCYAERQAIRHAGPGRPYEGLVRMTSQGPRWTGEVRVVDHAIDEPLSWRAPRRVFVDSMSDLFHEALPDSAIDRVLATMVLAPQHIFQVLTKRASRMHRYLSDPKLYGRVLDAAGELRAARPELTEIGISNPSTTPPSWIWWGVSVEDQASADKRIPALLDTPAAVRFVSYEPAIAPVDFRRLEVVTPEPPHKPGVWINALTGHVSGPDEMMPRLDWIIIGGESGQHPRLFDAAWARELIAHARAAERDGVRPAVFVKQLGKISLDTDYRGLGPLPLKHPKGGDPAEWPEDIRVREFPRDRRPAAYLAQLGLGPNPRLEQGKGQEGAEG